MKELFGVVPKFLLLEDFRKPVRFSLSKENLGVFKAVLKLASYQLWLSMQIWGRKY